ncbi:MAG TPA: DMT family transporter [Longimicrobiales bacterium]|nr:DMT family transporter [Longimicrobiales bacterium]
MLIAVLAVSWAGPLIRLTQAPALAVAMWRLVFSVAFIAAVVVARGGLRQAFRLTAAEWLLAVVSGLLLAAHFWSWIASISLTSVASSVVLVNTQPVIVALLSVAFLGEPPTRLEWGSIVVAVAGAAVIGWGDFGRGPAPFLGDALALAGAVFVSGYYVIGRRLRQRLDLWVYIGVVYGIAALALVVAVGLHPSVHMTGYAAGDWLVFLALAAGPMMLGHTGVNYALRYVPAYVANLALLGEPVGATLLAWWLPAIRETPSSQTVAGGVLILLGIALGVIRRRPTGV